MKGETMKKYLPPALASLSFILAYLYLYFAALPLFQDADVPWHLATGELILKQGKLPLTDPWSFASNGEPWYIISWLWDIIMALVSSALGLKGLFLFTIAMPALAVALLAYALLNRREAGGDAIILTLFMVAIGMADFTVARPHLAAYLFIVISQLVLHKSRNNETSRALWLLPLLMIPWVNMHGSFLVMFTLLGAYGLEAIFTRRWSWLKQLLIISAASVVALLINPYGITMAVAVMRTLDSVITRYIMEWLPFVFGNSLGISAWLIIFIVAGIAREPRVPVADKILSLAWLLVTLFSMRNAMVFLLVSAPALAIGLDALAKQLASIRTPRPDMLLTLQAPGMRERLAIAAVVIVIAGAPLLHMLRGQTYLTPDDDAAAAIAYLQEHLRGKRILNDYSYGGRIIYETGGTTPIFVDGRAGTAYSEAILSDYLAFLQLEKDWERAMEKYRIDGIMSGNDLPFAKAYATGQYREHWKQVYHDEVAGVYMRKKDER